MKSLSSVLKAMTVAIEAHQGQKRKGKETPYIVHPLSVGLILARAGANDDTICAGLLHDTLEDTALTKDFLEKEFGTKVAQIVNDVTEQDKTLPWEIRKQQALEHVKEMGKDSLLVKSADVLHNLTDQIADFEKEGEKMFERFNAPKEKQLKRYENLIAELKKYWPENPLLKELLENLEKVKKLWS